MSRIALPLNATKVKNAKAKEKEYSLHDGNNLSLIITTIGSKLWRFTYYHPITKKRLKISLGSYPAISLEQARKQAIYMKGLILQGIDPKEYKQKQIKEKQAEEITLNSISLQWKAWKTPKVKEKTMLKDWIRIERHLLPAIGEIPIRDITIPNIVDYLRPIEKTKPDTLRKVIGLLNDMMNYAVLMGIIPFNTVKDLKKAFYIPAHQHQASIDPMDLGKFLIVLNKASCLTTTKLLIYWQLITMVRPFEAVSVEWNEIDFINKVWNIPAEKMKGKKGRQRPHSVPLSNQALYILEQMKLYSGNFSYVFPNRNNTRKPCCSQTANNSIKNLGYKGILTAHGMRSVTSTYLNSLGKFDPYAVEKCLSHEDKNTVRATYNRTDYFSLRVDIMNYWGKFVEEQSNGFFT